MLPAWTGTRVAVKGIWAAFIAIIVLAALAAAAVQTVRLEGLRVWPFEVTGWIDKAATFEAERDAERSAHRKTKDDYRAAQAEATRLEAERLARVRDQQEEINDAIEQDYRARLADLGNRAERLRQDLRARTEPAGAPAGERGPALRDAAGRADGAPGDHRLPPPGGERAAAAIFGRTPGEQLERDIVATKQALQLDALIDWIEQQIAIDPNAPADIEAE